MATVADLVRETIGSTGQITSNIALGGAVAGHSAFSDVFTEDAYNIPVMVQEGNDKAICRAFYDQSADTVSLAVISSIVSGVRGTTALTLTTSSQIMIVAESSMLGGEISGDETTPIIAPLRHYLANDDDPDWPKRCRWTSWHNEDLGTATRGTRREFPAQPDAQLTASLLAVHDGSESGRPLWKSWVLSGATSLAYRNGEYIIGTSTGVIRIDLVRDRVLKHDTSGVSIANQNVATFNMSTATWTLVATSGAIVNNTVNHVAVTCQASADTDPETGMRYVTIALPTAGGGCVINPTGTAADMNVVYDTASTTAKTSVAFDKNGGLWFGQSSSAQVQYYASYASDGFAVTFTYDGTTVPALMGGSAKKIARANDAMLMASTGLTVLYPDFDTVANGMAAHVTNTYATGIMKGNTVLATLADSVSGNISATEQVTNGGFDTDISSWSNASTGGGSISWNASGYLDLTNSDGTASNQAIALQSFPVTAGKAYHVVVDKVANPSVVQIGTASGSGNLYQSPNDATDVDTYVLATTGTIWVTLRNSAYNGTASINSVSITEAIPDRSAKGNHMSVVGTITRSLIGAGGITAYSGFSASNYLQRDYGADFDFGTGDFYVMGWLKTQVSQSAAVILAKTSSGSTGFSVIKSTTSANGSPAIRIGSVTLSSTAITKDAEWHFFVALRRTGVAEIHVDGILTGSVSAPADVDETQPLTIGYSASDPAVSYPAGLANLRVGSGAPTAAEIRRIYAFEKRWFIDGNTPLLPGTPTGQPVYDLSSDTALIPTTGGAAFVSMTTGLVFKVISTANSNLASDSITSVTLAHDGGYIICCATNFVYHEPAFSLREGR